MGFIRGYRGGHLPGDELIVEAGTIGEQQRRRDVRKLRIRQRSLPGVGELLELDTRSGQTVTIIVHRSGRREVGLRRRGDETATVTAPLTAAESVALAGLLTGARFYLTAEDDA